MLLQVQKGCAIDQNGDIWYIRIHRVHFWLAVQTARERNILMDYRSVIDRMITILGIDREALDRRLSVVGADKRRRQSRNVLIAAVVFAVLAFGVKIWPLGLFAVIPLVMVIVRSAKERRRTLPQKVIDYLQLVPEKISVPLNDMLEGAKTDWKLNELEPLHRSARNMALAAAVLLAASFAGSVAGIAMDVKQVNARSTLPGYTTAPTATPAPAYLAENGTATLYNWRENLVDGTLTLPSEVDGLPVTAIGKLAFADRDDIVRVIIPEGVTKIDSGAFRSCSNLQEVVLPESLTDLGAEAFKRCMKLTAITIPEGVKELRAETFAFCTSLAEVHLPDEMIKISANAFDNCHALQTITLPEKLTTISAYAFRSCTKLKSITIPELVSSIGAYAFAECSALETVQMPQNMLNGKISERTFENCTSLVSIRIPKGVLKISERAFSGCTALAEVEFPSTVLEIGSSAFRGCTALRNVEVPSGCKVDERAFKDSPAKVRTK